MSNQYAPSESTSEWEERVEASSLGLFLHLAADELVPGDSMLGSDDDEYLIEQITPSGVGLEIKAIDQSGRAYTAHMPRNGYCKARQGRLAALDPDTKEFGLKTCFNCGEPRSEAYGWDYDDYVCKVCRQEIDCDS